MTEYNLSAEQLAKVDLMYNGYGQITVLPADYEPASDTGMYSTGTAVYGHGITQEEFNNLPEDVQKKIYIQHAGDAGKPSDVSLPRTTTPDGQEWKLKAKEAVDGYEGDAEKMRDLANKMEGELDQWLNSLNKVNNTKVPASAIGGTDASSSFEEMANQAQSGYSNYVQRIQTAYRGVIGKLRASADQIDNAEGQTNATVNSVTSPQTNVQL